MIFIKIIQIIIIFIFDKQRLTLKKSHIINVKLEAKVTKACLSFSVLDSSNNFRNLPICQRELEATLHTYLCMYVGLLLTPSGRLVEYIEYI